MRRFILSGLLALSVYTMFAQHQSISDTILLDEVNTYATVKKYQAGAKVETISAEQLEIAQAAGLDQLLMRFSPIYLKSNAGGLASIRIRGTAPDHTSVNFGGININSLTLGQTNMSSVPIYLFDGVDLQYGSSSAVNGSGSIGGALYLGLKNNWINGGRIKATVAAGSFGEQLYGTKVYLGNGKFESVSRAYYFKRKNDFPFDNPYTGDVENRDPLRDRQKGASVENMGLIQELNYRFSSKEFIKSAIWLEHDWHEVQPNMPTNLHYATNEQLDNKHVRIWSQYENSKQALNYRLGLGYVHDMQVYDSIDVQRIGTDRFISELEIKQDFDADLGFKAGVKYKYLAPDVYAYSDSVIDNEQHLDTYLSAFATFWHRLKITLNLRQSFVSNFEVPFTPSLGAEYRLITNEVSVLKMTSTIARSYRVPTFNDRYWGTQGNSNLRAEDGMNYELGLNYIYCTNGFQAEIKLNAFYMDVEDWIEWRNFGVWQAQNVMEVVSKGIEFQSNSTWQLGATDLNLRLSYNHNPVEAVENISETGIIHRQLIYVPEHMGNAFAMVNYNDWQFYLDGVYTGMRFSDDFGRKMDPYFLTNGGFVRKFHRKDQAFSFSFSIQNIFDLDYQNERYYAMPGRSFRLGISTNLNIL